MARLVMEEAKKFTDSKSIRDLVPEVRQRRGPIPIPEMASGRQKSYPMISAVPAQTLPSRLVTDKLVEVFNQKGGLEFHIVLFISSSFSVIWGNPAYNCYSPVLVAHASRTVICQRSRGCLCRRSRPV